MSQTKAQLVSPIGVLTATGINVSGIITASGFVGDGSGLINVSGVATNININTLGIITASSYSGTDINIAGIVTASAFFGDGSGLTNVSGVATNININTLGIITASSYSGTDINIAGIVTASAFFGDGSGLSNLNAVSISTTPPPGPVSGDLWYNPTYGRTFIWYDESLVGAGASAAWVDASPYDSSLGTDFNLNTTGIITASRFSTPGGLNVAGVVTASQFFTPGGLNINGNINAVGIITVTNISTPGGLNVAGIVTATRFETPGGLNVVGVVTATDFNSTSDISLKENVKTIENSLDTLVELRGVSFDWKDTGKKSYGIIAQELEQVLPELVSNTNPKTVNYNGLIGVLIESIKELKQEIENLKNTK